MGGMIKITKTQYWEFERKVKEGYQYKGETLTYLSIIGGNTYVTSKGYERVAYRDLVGYYLLSEVFVELFGK
jgi:hypothetical protein